VVRFKPTANVSSWLLTVADVLPLSHRAVLPYTLGEAVAEFGAFALWVPAVKWNSSPAVRKNRASLRSEIQAQTEALGQRLQASCASLLKDLSDDKDPKAVVAAAAQFEDIWRSKATIVEAFMDLSDKAKIPGTNSRELRKLSAILASQVGPSAHGSLSLLSYAAEALIDTEESLARWRDTSFSEPLTESRRLEMAKDILIAPPAGHVVVWIVYYRATVLRMRDTAGPITFLRADWAIPNAFDGGPNNYPEQSELHDMREEVPWLDELHVEALKEENRVVLVRIDLGERQIAGAEEEARRRIDALVGIAVEAGGVSWKSAKAAAVLLDGKVRGCSMGLALRPATAPDDSYGIGVTAELLSNVTEQLGDVLAQGPMPEHLVEALVSLREARMTDHRDVLFYGAPRVRHRVATAIEDHAMELIAAVLRVGPEELAKAIQRRDALDRADSHLARQLTAPFNDAEARNDHEVRRELERRMVRYSDDGRRLSVAKAVALKSEISALPMSDLQRADFENAIEICVDPESERRFLLQTWREVDLLRARHRRVRNAINHGLPLSLTTLNSVREYAESGSRTGLNIALTWFKAGEPGEVLLQREEAAWVERMKRIDSGLSLEDTELDEQP
jgi:hypothetical protein